MAVYGQGIARHFLGHVEDPSPLAEALGRVVVALRAELQPTR